MASLEIDESENRIVGGYELVWGDMKAYPTAVRIRP
jgi:hypothetical protein